MKTAVFSASQFDHDYFTPEAQKQGIELTFFATALDYETVALAQGFEIVSVFCNDNLNSETVDALAGMGVRLIARRGTGVNNVDLEACERNSIRVVRVPEYSPHSVAEHTFGLILTLNRKIHKAYNRIREGNFALNGLMGFDLHGRTIGIVGAGRIGGCVARIASGFGMNVLISDPQPNPELAGFGKVVELPLLLEQSDIVTLHCPLNNQTHHLIDATALDRMKRGAMLVNTSRGALLHTTELIKRLKSGQTGSLAIDVYEEEADIFFEDRSAMLLQDDVFARLLTFSNVLITGHQAFFTHEAMTQIAETTVSSIVAFINGAPLKYEISFSPASSMATTG